MRGGVKKGEGLRRTNSSYKHSHGDVKCSSIANTIVITMCGARWVLDLWRGHFIRYVRVHV